MSTKDWSNDEPTSPPATFELQERNNSLVTTKPIIITDPVPSTSQQGVTAIHHQHQSPVASPPKALTSSAQTATVAVTVATIGNNTSANISNNNDIYINNSKQKTPKLGNLPALSISSPSPPHEQEELML